jgi:hypothetical protein
VVLVNFNFTLPCPRAPKVRWRARAGALALGQGPKPFLLCCAPPRALWRASAAWVGRSARAGWVRVCDGRRSSAGWRAMVRRLRHPSERARTSVDAVRAEKLAASSPSTCRSYCEVRRAAEGVGSTQSKEMPNLYDLSLRIANPIAPHRPLWAAPTGWYAEHDGCMRWGSWRASWGAT